MDNGKTVVEKVTVFIDGQTEMNIMESGRKIRSREMESNKREVTCTGLNMIETI